MMNITPQTKQIQTKYMKMLDGKMKLSTLINDTGEMYKGCWQ